MLHSICNIDKHRHLNVVNVHSSATASLEGEVEPGLLPPGMTGGLLLLDWLAGTRHEDQVKIDVKVGVCFRGQQVGGCQPGIRFRAREGGYEKAAGDTGAAI